MMRVIRWTVFLRSHLWGQIEQGSLVGVVTDPQKAPVAGAAVEFLSLDNEREALDGHQLRPANTTRCRCQPGGTRSRCGSRDSATGPRK